MCVESTCAFFFCSDWTATFAHVTCEHFQQNQEKRNIEEAAGKHHLSVSEKPTGKETKAQAKAALALAQKSTASVGKFDKKLKGEKKAPMKRKVEHMSGGAASEKSRSLEMLGKIVSIDSATFDEAKAANKGLGSVSTVCPSVSVCACSCLHICMHTFVSLFSDIPPSPPDGQ